MSHKITTKQREFFDDLRKLCSRHHGFIGAEIGTHGSPRLYFWLDETRFTARCTGTEIIDLEINFGSERVE